MELKELYKEENKNLLYSISWLNKNSVFDKSVGSFRDIDLFTFLENIHEFDYKKDIFYDDVYLIIEYTKDSILHLMHNINKEIKREHKILPLSQAKEFDSKTVLWLSRQDGRTIKEKLKNNKIKTVKRFRNIDTYENRVLKLFLKKLLDVYEYRVDKSDEKTSYLFQKIRRWLRGSDANDIDEYRNIVYNNILLHHPHYSKIFKSYKWLNRLNEKLEHCKSIYPAQFKTIIQFEILAQLQFLTQEAKVLPTTLNNEKLRAFDIKVNQAVLNINVDQVISKINDEMLKKKLTFLTIRDFAKYLIDHEIKVKRTKDRFFSLEYSDDILFIDLFRLFPVVIARGKSISMPIMLKHRVGDVVVSANNTKVIDLNHEFYTLPEILKTYNTQVLRYFLEDISKQFKGKQLNYIIPDYVNVFEFSQAKKSINTYFPKNRNIPKSIAAGINYLFSGKVEKNDTLIYIQKNHDNDLYVTPLLVRYDKELQNITNGLYIEKHPTKKLKDDNDVLSVLEQHFTPEISQKILSKFLQSGVKGVIKEKIAFCIDNDTVYLNNVKFQSVKDFKRKSRIKKLFPSKKLFKANYIEIKDDKFENLNNFKKLLEFEEKGHVLWKEHLPKLAMEINDNGYFTEFVLVDHDSEVVNNAIQIKNHFGLPAGVEEISFPLIFGEENIDYEAYISSSQMPFDKEVECELKLTYNYEDETPYRLTFIPLDTTFKPLKVLWREKAYSDSVELPIPDYPTKKIWSDFENYNDRNLLDWMMKNFEFIVDLNDFYLEKSKKFIYLDNVYFDWFQDRNGFYAAKLQVPGLGETFFHQENFDNFNKDIHAVSFEIKKSVRGGYQAINIVADKQLSLTIINKFRKSLRFPLYTIWKDGNSLSDIDVPNEFRVKAAEAISAAIGIFKSNEVDNNLKKEIMLFLSALHRDTPNGVLNLLLKFLASDKYIKKYRDVFPYAVGCVDTELQKVLFEKILKLLYEDVEQKSSYGLKMLGIMLWRCEKVVYLLDKKQIDTIIDKLYTSILLKMKRDSELIQYRTNKIKTSVVNRLELLLAIIRYRKIDTVLHPQEEITKKYIELIDNLTEKTIKKKLEIQSKIDLQLNKPEAFTKTPDLLYALRAYLSGDTDAANSIKIIGVSDD